MMSFINEAIKIFRESSHPLFEDDRQHIAITFSKGAYLQMEKRTGILYLESALGEVSIAPDLEEIKAFLARLPKGMVLTCLNSSDEEFLSDVEGVEIHERLTFLSQPVLAPNKGVEEIVEGELSWAGWNETIFPRVRVAYEGGVTWYLTGEARYVYAAEFFLTCAWACGDEEDSHEA